MKSRALELFLFLVILAGLGLEITAGAGDRETIIQETEVQAAYHSAGETVGESPEKLLPPELARFSAALEDSGSGQATVATDSQSIFVSTGTQSGGICQSAPILLKSAREIAAAPLLEMVPANFKGWRESAGELVDRASALNEECKGANPGSIDGRFGQVKAQFAKLLSLHR